MNDGLNTSQSTTHAVVIGGSIAGLLAAKVLTRHFDRVTLIERDPLPDSAAPRKGVPQARHIHVLLMRGLLILEQLFPGITEELRLAGAPLYDTSADVAWLTPAGWATRFQSDLIKLTFSRELLEFTVRRRLAESQNVYILDQWAVAGLIPKREGQVGGVRIRSTAATGDR